MSGTDLPTQEISEDAVELLARQAWRRRHSITWESGADEDREGFLAVARLDLAALVASGYRREAKVPEHLLGDGPCADCGTVDNIIWFTDSVFWNAVVRQGDYQEPILCIPCFVKRADAAGFYPTGWRLTPEFHWETHEERAARWPDPGPVPVRCRLCPGLPYYAAEDYQGHVLGVHGDRAAALEQAQPLLAAGSEVESLEPVEPTPAEPVSSTGEEPKTDDA